jgi:hypothetical protein
MKIVAISKKLYIFLLLINNVFLLRLNSQNSNSIKNQNEIKNQYQNKSKEKLGELEGEKINLSGQINLKGSLNSEKHKKTHFTKSLNSSSIKKEETNIKTNIKTNTQPTGNIKTEDFKSPILAELWVKYFKYTNSELNIKSPKNFFVNIGYYQQSRLFPNADVTKGDEFIRDKNYFYLSIFENSFVFNSSKKVNKIKKIIPY